MDGTPERRWLLFSVRALFVVLTAALAAEVRGLEIETAHGPPTLQESAGNVFDPAPALQPWIDGLAVVGPVALVAAVLCVMFAGFRTTRQQCARTLWVALGLFLAFVASLTANAVLTYRCLDPVAAAGSMQPADLGGMVISYDQQSADTDVQPPDAEEQAPDRGQQAPDFTVTTLDGRAVRLADLRGRVVLVNFFATSCGPCMQELPELQKVWEEFHAQDGFAMLVIGREETTETLQALSRQRGFTFPLASDPARAAFARFATQGIPRTYLISREGRILRECLGYRPEELFDLTNVLRTELAKRERNRRL